MRYTYLGLSVFALACILYIESFLFGNLAPLFFGFGIIAYMIYDRLAFSHQLSEQDIEVEREVLEQMLFAEKPFTVVTRIRNRGGPAKVHVEDRLPEGLTLVSGSNEASLELNRGEVAKLKYAVRPAKRGYFHFQEVRLRRRDRSGLFESETVAAHDTQARIHSSREELRKAHTIARREHLEVLGKSPERWARTRELHFEGIRDYQPGDRFRDIHWKSTSRLLKLMTKIYERETMVPTTIMLDCGRSMRVRTAYGSKLDHGMRLAIQLSKVLLSGYHPAGMVAFDEYGTLAKVPPGVKRRQYDDILKALLHLPEEIATEQDVQPDQRPPAPAAGLRGGADQFLSVVSTFMTGREGRARAARAKMGIEDSVREAVARGGKGQMFMIISDLESNHDAIVRSASFARAHAHRVILISPFSGLYDTTRAALDAPQLEQMYESYLDRMRTVVRLQRLGVLVIEVGPKDEAATVARGIRRVVA